MKFALILTTAFLWALWLGGTIIVFVFGVRFQALLSDAVFREAVRAMFQIFSHYELILAGLVLLSAGMLLVSYPSKAAVLLLGCLILAGGMAVTVSLGLMPRMEMLRAEGKTQMTENGKPTEFARLHGKSMIAMTIQACLLLLTGAVVMKLDTSPMEKPPVEPEDTNGFKEQGYGGRALHFD